MGTTTELTKQQKMSAGLRELADFYDEHPEFPVKAMWMYIYVINRKEFIGLAKQLGTFTKNVDGSDYQIVRRFDNAYVQVYASRKEVCTKRLVTKTIEVEEWDCPEHLLSDEDHPHAEPNDL